MNKKGYPPSQKKMKGKRIADKEEKPPLHVIMNLVCILIPALLAQQVTEYFHHQVELPARGGAGSGQVADQPRNQPFNLKLTIGEDGAFMIVNAKTLSAGEQGLIAQGPGLLLPPGPAGPQYEVLQRLLMREKRDRLGGQPPEAFPDPDQITVAAPHEMEYERVMQALDYVRFEAAVDFSTAEPLFSVISLSPGAIGG